MIEEDHVLEAIGNYKRFKSNRKINAISEIDCKIIFSLVEYADYGSEQIKQVFEDYKLIEDEEFFEKLINYIQSYQSTEIFQGCELNEDSAFIGMKDIKMTRLKRYLISDYQIDHMIEADTNKMLPVLILNETDLHMTKVGPYANKHLVYRSEQDRNQDLLKLDRLL